MFARTFARIQLLRSLHNSKTFEKRVMFSHCFFNFFVNIVKITKFNRNLRNMLKVERNIAKTLLKTDIAAERNKQTNNENS